MAAVPCVGQFVEQPFKRHLRVRFRFVGLDPAARDAFLARFDLYTRRGGG